MPPAVADAVADFVEQRCRAHLRTPGRTDEAVLAKLRLVEDYRTARRQRRGMTADNLAYAVLDGARTWSQDLAFDPEWQRWLSPGRDVPPEASAD